MDLNKQYKILYQKPKGYGSWYLLNEYDSLDIANAKYDEYAQKESLYHGYQLIEVVCTTLRQS